MLFISSTNDAWASFGVVPFCSVMLALNGWIPFYFSPAREFEMSNQLQKGTEKIISCLTVRYALPDLLGNCGYLIARRNFNFKFNSIYLSHLPSSGVTYSFILIEPQ